MIRREPTKPASVDPLAAELLTGLEDCAAAKHIVLGGYFALKHYHDYRPTHDVDAWWSSEAGEKDREEVRRALRLSFDKLAARKQMTVKVRRFGDTESWELVSEGTKAFSFQIAARNVQIEPHLQSPWPPLMIESFAENLGSKMNALVQRAAPRDFVDVYTINQTSLASPVECWKLWQMKNPDLHVDDARAEVTRHLEALELRRPLRTIDALEERRRVEAIRTWFREEFLPFPL